MSAVLQWVLGARVTWHNTHLLPKTTYVMVSNHQTAGDLLSLYSLPHRIIHLVSTGIPEAATKVKNHRLFLQHASPDVYKELASSSRRDPVHLFPGALRFDIDYLPVLNTVTNPIVYGVSLLFHVVATA